MDLQTWIKMQNNRIRQNAEVVTLNQAYHISSNPKIKRFIPAISQRQAPTEDRTVPRVCVSPHLVGAICGHAAVSMDAIDSWFNKKMFEMSIYDMPFTEYVKPNAKLVFDAEDTDEHWVVPNDMKSVTFKADIIGTFVLYSSVDIFDQGISTFELSFIVRAERPICVYGKEYRTGYFKVVIESKSSIGKYTWGNKYKLKEIIPSNAAEYRAITKRINKNITVGGA